MSAPNCNVHLKRRNVWPEFFLSLRDWCVGDNGRYGYLLRISDN